MVTEVNSVDGQGWLITAQQRTAIISAVEGATIAQVIFAFYDGTGTRGQAGARKTTATFEVVAPTGINQSTKIYFVVAPFAASLGAPVTGLLEESGDTPRVRLSSSIGSNIRMSIFTVTG